MSLFQDSALRKACRENAAPEPAWEEFRAFFLNPAVQANIRAQTEEQLQGEFLAKLFGEVLGYTLAPAEGHNLTRELKNVLNARSADGALLRGGKVCAVIELKDTRTTDLDRVEAQAFGYKNAHRGVRYVITSNFERLRLYIDSTLDFIEFSLFELTRAEFDRLWLALSKETLLDRDLPARLFDASRRNESSITEKLYADYSAFKRELFDDILARRETPPARDEKLLLFRKTQKLLDRFIFIFFCEDRGLLPVNSTETIIKKWRSDRAWDPEARLYPQFVKYFGFINGGNAALGIHAYNGGLFAPDPVLDGLVLDDALLARWTQKLSDYDFATEVDVNILGHIFEHSLSEIEEMAAALEAGGSGGNAPAVSKRKKDGVFYTPPFVTRFIVENTLGALCAEKKAGLGITDELFAPREPHRKRGGRAADPQRDRLEGLLAEYRAWLLGLKICDPACGSGAFLVAALQFLIREHKKIDRWSANIQTGAGALVFEDVDASILERNLYGVDINEESVEIARLSLWLHTCRPGRKLSDLSANIKCGNSLITEEFDWEKEFPFGGFDVVIGNPPYVQLQTMGEMSARYEKCGFEVFDKLSDIYCLFVERGFQILKPQGLISYIMPNKWMQVGYGEALRKFFLKKGLIRLIDFGDIQIFDGATTYPCIFIATHKTSNGYILISVLKDIFSSDFETHVLEREEKFETSFFSKDIWTISSRKENILMARLEKECITLSEYIHGEAHYGIKPGVTKAFIIDASTKDQLIEQDPNSQNILKPMLLGRGMTPYWSDSGYWLIDAHNGVKKEGLPRIDINAYPAVKSHLDQYITKLTSRSDKGDTPYNLRNCAYYSKFLQPKIMYQRFQVKPCFIFDDSGYFCNDSIWFLSTNDKALLAVLNSSTGWWFIQKKCPAIQNGHQLIWDNFSQILVPRPEKMVDSPLAALAEERVRLTRELQSVRAKFHRSLLNHFDPFKITGALETFETLEFKDFLKELKKQKAKPKLSEEAEWEEFFNTSKSEILRLAAETARIDAEIDAAVAGLYGLAPDGG